MKIFLLTILVSIFIFFIYRVLFNENRRTNFPRKKIRKWMRMSNEERRINDEHELIKASRRKKRLLNEIRKEYNFDQY